MRCLHACHLHRVCRRALVAHASSRQQAGHVRYCASSATAGGADVEWAGLHSWRRQVNEAHSWSTEGVGAPCSSAHVSTTPVELPDTLSKCGRLVLSTAEPDAKMRLTHAAFARWCTGSLAGEAAARSAAQDADCEQLAASAEFTRAPHAGPH